MKKLTRDRLQSYLAGLKMMCFVDDDGDLCTATQTEGFAHKIHLYFVISDDGWLIVNGAVPDCPIDDQKMGTALNAINNHHIYCPTGPQGMLMPHFIAFSESFYICREMNEPYIRTVFLPHAVKGICSALAAVYKEIGVG